MAQEFRRESRYIVFKMRDVEASLSAEGQRRLKDLMTAVELHRSSQEKPPLECVVVEKDWPEFDRVWQMIEARMGGQEPVVDRIIKMIASELPKTIGTLNSELLLADLRKVAALIDGGPADYAKDAARYRWLRDVSVPPHNFYISVPEEFHGVKFRAADVDSYIDAAIAKAEGRS